MKTFTLFASSPALRETLAHHQPDTWAMNKGFALGVWAGTVELSSVTQEYNFGDAMDKAARICQDKGETCVLVITDAEESARRVAHWSAPFASFMDAKRAMSGVPAWSYWQGRAHIYGPRPIRVDAYPDSETGEVWAALVNQYGECSLLSAQVYSEVEL
ncbi:MAG: hypothetical protein JSS77_16135 [Acidobacteria bacterium]|nr:hypothetical protein [Acidobacteriota bacterium]